ncbi:MAG TPA: xanthine dehydrogenase family protein subunit M [Candidatus Sumerlaeota bacterium]|nr:xanthine dehydrogenase family protein subunit M [Candidatus Sumerlaeota bacterium]HRR30670.1 xanthine dehydrogenase family protein subunit M [Candidatus Sumerlaeia bacterium]HON49856.1 xanthine dehydrogenase family protein subunit M [Candidatus Sumerlaeota bacterium]HOR63896.1 xanthine dehydrogenase family protein subunit M [Candidatus Sumerlaeota bacterium]HPL75044.1 xanthine dehydrogenase family protein subunit M [Candidatus Sumerlaeota bacterium]
MILPEFRVMAPENLYEALDLLDGYGPEGAMVLAGGTDLLVRMKEGSLRPSTVIVLDKVPNLDFIEMSADKIRIGAMTTFDQVISSDIIRDYAPVLWSAAQSLGSPQLRNRATIGGNICNGSPCADSLPPLYVLDAVAILESANGERRLPIEKCFKGPKETVFYRNELLTAVEFAIPAQSANSFFFASGQRKALAITKISVAGQFNFIEGVVQMARIAYGSVAPSVLRGAAVEEYIQWQSLSQETIKKSVSLCRNEIKPIDDIRSTADWRREATGVLLQRGLELLAEKNQPPAQI